MGSHGSLMCTADAGCAHSLGCYSRADETKSRPMLVQSARDLETDRVNSWTTDRIVLPGSRQLGCTPCQDTRAPQTYIADAAAGGVVRDTSDGLMWAEEEIANI
uniref:Uncharacterized protein n=1 Tax=Noctiluca scintillans TaxID=2966 RepID=A0A7S1FC51_NOCSC